MASTSSGSLSHWSLCIATMTPKRRLCHRGGIWPRGLLNYSLKHTIRRMTIVAPANQIAQSISAGCMTPRVEGDEFVMGKIN